MKTLSLSLLRGLCGEFGGNRVDKSGRGRGMDGWARERRDDAISAGSIVFHSFFLSFILSFLLSCPSLSFPGLCQWSIGKDGECLIFLSVYMCYCILSLFSFSHFLSSFLLWFSSLVPQMYLSVHLFSLVVFIFKKGKIKIRKELSAPNMAE